MRAARLQRIFRNRLPAREALAAFAAALVVLLVHQSLPRLRRPRPLAPPRPVLLSRVVPELDARGTPAEVLKRLAEAARVTFVIHPEGFDPDEPRPSLFSGDGPPIPIPPPQLDLRLRGVTLAQALCIVNELSPYVATVTDCRGDVVTLDFLRGQAPPEVRMHDLSRLDREAAAFSLAFSRTAFGAAAPAAPNAPALEWSQAQLRRVLDRQLPGPPEVTDNRTAGAYWFLRAEPAFHDHLDGFLAILEEPEARVAPPAPGAAAGAEGAAQGAAR